MKTDVEEAKGESIPIFPYPNRKLVRQFFRPMNSICPNNSVCARRIRKLHQAIRVGEDCEGPSINQVDRIVTPEMRAGFSDKGETKVVRCCTIQRIVRNHLATMLVLQRVSFGCRRMSLTQTSIQTQTLAHEPEPKLGLFNRPTRRKTILHQPGNDCRMELGFLSGFGGLPESYGRRQCAEGL